MTEDELFQAVHEYELTRREVAPESPTGQAARRALLDAIRVFAGAEIAAAGGVLTDHKTMTLLAAKDRVCDACLAVDDWQSKDDFRRWADELALRDAKEALRALQEKAR